MILARRDAGLAPRPRYVIGMNAITTAIVIVGLGLPSLSAPAAAAPPDASAPTHFVGVDIMGFAGFLRVNVGRFAAYYEHVFGDHHGVRVAGDVVHVHHAADHQQAHQWTFGGQATYRYHFEALEAGPSGTPFAGLSVAYRRQMGHFGVEGEPDFTELSGSQLAVVPQIGYRFWLPSLSLSVVTSMGVGYGPWSIEADRDDELGRAQAQIAEDILAATPVVVEIELSFAFGF